MAYRKIGRLVVSYDADTTSYDRAATRVQKSMGAIRAGMRRLRAAAQRLSRSFQRLARRMVSLRGIVGLLAGITGFGLLLKKAADFGADLRELSMQVGLSVRDLQGWQRAFQANGLAVEKTRKVLGQFAYAVAEASRGSETYARLFRRLGVTLADWRGQLFPIHELLLRTADGFRGLTNATEKAGLATLLFGARNSKVLVTLDDGRTAIENSMKGFLALGHLTDRQAANLKDLAQEFANFKDTLEAVIYGAIADNAEIFSKLLQNIARLVREQGPRFIALLSEIVDKWDAVESAVRRAIDATYDFFNQPEPSHPLAGVWEGRDTGRALRERAAAAVAAPSPPPRISIGGRGIVEDTPRGSEFKAAAREAESFRYKIVDLRTPLDRFREAALQTFSDWQEHMREAGKTALDFGRQFADVTTSAVDRLVDGIAEGTFTIKGFLRSLLVDIIKVTLRATIMQNIIAAGNAIQGGVGPLGSVLANLFGTAGASYGATGAGTLNTGPGGFLVGGVAEGGPVQGGSRYLVGERGPELFVPSRDGHVISSEDLAARFGGGGAVYNFSPVIQGQSDPTLIRAEIQRAYPYFQESILAVQNQRANRPSTARQSQRA